ncbi:hypothetical protein GCM10010517_19070 [Streptosporangium fragile]|uniref:Antigen 84 n=1 Tax=Streptosporangium fragile TaxID=46186 RepID=A0ABN3VUT8_9ACTN
MDRFPRVLGVRTGYDPDQVDSLIRRIEGTLGRGSPDGEPITADEIREARFRTKLGGYHEIAVDFALEAFIVAIEARSAEAHPPVSPLRPGVPADSPPPPSEVLPEPPHPTAPYADRAEPDPPYAGPPYADVPYAGPPYADVPHEAPPHGGAAHETIPPDEVSYGQVPSGAVPYGGVPYGDVPPAPPPYGEVGGVAGTAELEEHAVRVERAAFRPGRLGMGYNEDEVDAFLDRVVATLRGTTDDPLTAADVRRVRFTTVLLKPGYAVGEVDDLLADLAGVLETHLGR